MKNLNCVDASWAKMRIFVSYPWIREIPGERRGAPLTQPLDRNFIIDQGPGHRHVGRTNFSIWRHIEDQIHLGYNHNKSQRCVRITWFSSRGGGKRIFCLQLSPTFVHLLRHFLKNPPMFTIHGPGLSQAQFIIQTSGNGDCIGWKKSIIAVSTTMEMSTTKTT